MIPKRNTFKVNPMNIGPWLRWRLWVIIWKNKNAHWRNLGWSHHIARGDWFNTQQMVLSIYNGMPYRRKLVRATSGLDRNRFWPCTNWVMPIHLCVFLGRLSDLKSKRRRQLLSCLSTLEGWHRQAFCLWPGKATWGLYWTFARQYGEHLKLVWVVSQIHIVRCRGFLGPIYLSCGCHHPCLWDQADR